MKFIIVIITVTFSCLVSALMRRSTHAYRFVDRLKENTIRKLQSHNNNNNQESIISVAKEKIPFEIKKYSSYFPHITSIQWNQLQELSLQLLDWNEKINLISRKEIHQYLVSRHLIPSLCLSLVSPNLAKEKTIIDVGTGGGFPGLPLAIVNAQSEFTLLDSSVKKMKVVEDLVRSIGLKNVHCITSRAEDYRERKFDFLLGRAVTAIPNYLSYASHLLKPSSSSSSSSSSSPSSSSSLLSVPSSSSLRPTLQTAEEGLLYLKGGDYLNELSEASIQTSEVKMLTDVIPSLESDKYVLFVPADEIRRYYTAKQRKEKK